MSQQLSVDGFKWIEDTFQFNENIMRSYNRKRDKGYFLEADIQYPEKLQEVYNDLSFLPERTKIEKVEKFVANLHDKAEYFIHIRNLKEALTHGLILRKVHRIIKINQQAWLKSYICMNTNLKTKAKIKFEREAF